MDQGEKSKIDIKQHIHDYRNCICIQVTPNAPEIHIFNTFKLKNSTNTYYSG